MREGTVFCRQMREKNQENLQIHINTQIKPELQSNKSLFCHAWFTRRKDKKYAINGCVHYGAIYKSIDGWIGASLSRIRFSASICCYYNQVVTLFPKHYSLIKVAVHHNSIMKLGDPPEWIS